MKFQLNIENILSKNFYLLNHAWDLCKIGSKNNKSKFFLLIIFLIITGFTESLPVILVIPFITIIGYPERALEAPIIKQISNFVSINDPTQLLLPFLILFVALVLINSFLRLYLIDFIFMVKASIANNLSKAAFKRILMSTYEFQIETNSSKIINDFNDSMGCSISYIQTFLNMMREYHLYRLHL